MRDSRYQVARQPHYVVAFNRDRDLYQVPWALEEEGKLTSLVTDLYEPNSTLGRKLMKSLGLGHRKCAGLASEKVKWCWRAIWLQMVALKGARSVVEKNQAFRAIDSAISEMAGKVAQRSGADLFLYSGYAREAFLRLRASNRLKLLFVYHPQGEFVRDLLVRDHELHPEAAESHRAHLSEISLNEGERVREELGLSDGVACASSFTAASVRACPEMTGKIVEVIPYGFGSADSLFAHEPEGHRNRKPSVLFVGQGVQRKGLHHLVKAWSRGLFKDAQLTLVVSCLDPGIRRLVDSLPEQPRVLSGLTTAALQNEYANADIFVLPSLVEGFGLVYLEALAAGCLVVGTANTGLPDLNLGREAARLARPGDIDDLEEVLRAAIKDVNEGVIDRDLIQRSAGGVPWARFREGIRQFVRQVENQTVNHQV
jgi:glycosyltransferase involved in cell wall biosynthesis